MPSHTEAEKRRRRRRPKGPIGNPTTDELAALLQQRGRKVPGSVTDVPAITAEIPSSPQQTGPTLASRSRIAAQIATSGAVAVGQQVRQLPGRVGGSVARALIPETAQDAQSPTAPPAPPAPPADNFLQLTPENQAAVERRISSRAQRRAQEVSRQTAPATDPFAVAVNQTLNDPNVAPFNARPEILRAATRAAGGPLALGERFAASRQSQRLQDVAAGSGGALRFNEATGRLSPTNTTLAPPAGNLSEADRSARLKASQDRNATAREARTKRGEARRLEASGGRGTDISDVLFARTQERRRANIEAGGSVGRLRRQQGAAAERSRLIGIEEQKAFAAQIAANRDDPKVIAAGLGSSDPAVVQSFARRFLGTGAQGGPAEATDPETAQRDNDIIESATNYQTDAGQGATQKGIDIAGAIGRIINDSTRVGVLGQIKDQPKMNRRFDQALKNIADLPEGPERDTLIQSLMQTLAIAVGDTKPGFFGSLTGIAGTNAAALRRQILINYITRLKALKTSTTRARDQSNS